MRLINLEVMHNQVQSLFATSHVIGKTYNVTRNNHVDSLISLSLLLKTQHKLQLLKADLN